MSDLLKKMTNIEEVLIDATAIVFASLLINPVEMIHNPIYQLTKGSGLFGGFCNFMAGKCTKRNLRNRYERGILNSLGVASIAGLYNYASSDSNIESITSPLIVIYYYGLGFTLSYFGPKIISSIITMSEKSFKPSNERLAEKIRDIPLSIEKRMNSFPENLNEN